MFNLPAIQSRLWLGPHLNLQGAADATAWIETGQPSVVKLVDTDPPGEFHQRPAWTLWIGRKYENDFDPNNPAQNGFATDAVAAAAQYVERYLAQAIQRNPLIPCWEFNNEPVITTPERMTWYATFLAEGARILRETYNVTAVMGNWSVGHPLVELNLWPHYVPALEAARRYGAILGRHSYGPLNDFYALRHRRDNAIFTALGYPNLPVAITECGADNVSATDGPNQPWKFYYGGDENAYGDYLLQLEAALREDAAYCLGGAVFTYGFGWDEFSLNDRGIGRRLSERGQTLPLRPLFTVPAPTPTPTPSPTPNPQPVAPPAVTHRTTVTINTYAHPWAGRAEPPVRRILPAGSLVRVHGHYQPLEMDTLWAALNAECDEWVAATALQPLGLPPR